MGGLRGCLNGARDARNKPKQSEEEQGKTRRVASRTPKAVHALALALPLANMLVFF